MNRRKFFGAIGSGVIAAFMPKLFGRGTPGADPVAPDLEVDRIHIEALRGMDFGDGDFTVEAWVRFDGRPWKHCVRSVAHGLENYFIDSEQVTRDEYENAGGQLVDFPGFESGDYIDVRT